MSNTKPIARSPRAPSFALGESVKNALRLYEANGKHSVPADVAAKTLGYSGANNGSAARALASMKSFGLLDSNNKGDVSVSADVEGYKYAPDEEHKSELLVRWLRSPKIYAELLDEYHDRLPSDQAIRYKLIKKGFHPPAAEECLKNLKASVDFANYFSRRIESEPAAPAEDELWGGDSQNFTDGPSAAPQPPPPFPPHPSTRFALPPNVPPPPPPGFPPLRTAQYVPSHQPQVSDAVAGDRILVRLSKGRRAWIEVPTPLYEADKQILKNQIDLIVTDDEDEDA